MDLTATQYDTAYDWLRATGLLETPLHGQRAAQAVFEKALAHNPPGWFQDADLLVRSPDELPDDALRAAEAVGLEPAEAYQRIAAAWGKVDTAERKRIGDAGELALVALISASTDHPVDHCAAHTDGLGFDISVGAGPVQAHIEVKTTTRRNRLLIYLSRNEYEVMQRDPDWLLAAVRLDAELEIAALGTVPRDWIAANTPKDFGSYGRWDSCRIEVPIGEIRPGLKDLEPLLAIRPPSPLAGNNPWSALYPPTSIRSSAIAFLRAGLSRWTRSAPRSGLRPGAPRT